MDLAIIALTASAAGGHDEIVRSWDLSAGEALWRLFLILFFVFLNGFFVAAEFAIVKVRGSQLDALVEMGTKRAHFARHVTERLDAYLSATQLGITLASLALGWLGEPYLATLIQPVFFLFGMNPPDAVVSWTTLILAFSTITFLHIVLGELMPKSLAIRRSLGTTLVIARPLGFFHTLFRAPIFLLNGCANKLLKVFFNIDPVSENEHLHSAEELRLLVKETERSDEVTATEREILIKALELNDLHVRDILTPRSDVISLDLHDPFEENLREALDSGHTRFPLVDGHLDDTLGLIHLKDVLRIVHDAEPNLDAIKRPMPTVPEMMALDDLLKLFLRERVHLALVVDEFGGTLGIVTLDNVLEELVGDIQDEFDLAEAEQQLRKISEDEFFVEGTMPLYELEEDTQLELESPDVSTIGGYVTHLLGHLPEVGEQVEIEGFVVTVTETDGKSVGEVHFRRQPDGGGDEQESDAGNGAGSAKAEGESRKEETSRNPAGPAR